MKVCISLPDKIIIKLQALCDETGLSKSTCIQVLINEWYNKLNKVKEETK